MIRHWYRPAPSIRIAGAILVAVVAFSLQCNATAGEIDPDAEECTIAVLSGKAAPDGRPILWKNRDTYILNNEVVYFKDGTYDYVALVNAGDFSRAWIGLNDQGFAILNALSHNLADSMSGGITNGELMKRALQVCATVDAFELLLKETNNPGRENPANLGVIDGIGGAAIFEVGNWSWKRFNAADPEVTPTGFLVRANFSLSADTSWVDTYRYHRARRLLREAIDGDAANVRYVIDRVARDIRSAKVDPYPLPYEGTPPGYPEAKGYVDAGNTINRRSSTAAGIIHGVQPGEDPLLATFYALVGQPVVTIALPVWVAAGDTPPELNGKVTSPLCDLAIERKTDSYDGPYNSSLLNTYRLVGNCRNSYLALVERVERWMFPIIEDHLEKWRETGVDPAKMAFVETGIAARAFVAYKGGPLPYPPLALSVEIGPNPMQTKTTIHYELEVAPPPGATIDLLDVSGRRIRRLSTCGNPDLNGTLCWDGCDGNGTRVAAGIYFLKPSWAGGQAAASVVVVR